jgi:N-acetyl-anhydromuramyl-L-alanine amidase AmpD
MTTKLSREYINSPEFATEVTKFPKIIKKPLTKGQYVTEVVPKTSIFLHHTSGSSAQGAWAWWNQTPARVGTAYIIDRDGSIWECFEPKYFASHLGLRGPNRIEKTSIGIELVSVGGLYKGPDGKANMFYPLHPKTLSGKVIPPNEIFDAPGFHRSFDTFQKYTDAQVIALSQLIGYLKGMFTSIEIPAEFTAKSLEFDSSVQAKAKGGIFSHTTVRADKSDIAPQPELIMAIDRVCKLLQPKKATPKS